MPRSTNAVARKQRRKKILKAAKGYFGRRKNVYTVAKNAVEKGMSYSYIHRKQKKRNFRKLWITRINAGVRQHGLSYSKFIVKPHKFLLESLVIEGLRFDNISCKPSTLQNMTAP